MTTSDSEAKRLQILADLIQYEVSGNFSPLTVELGPYSSFLLVGLIQLAWRNPDLSENMHDFAERIGREIQQAAS